MKKYFRALGALVVVVGALAYGGVVGHAETYRWPFSGAGTVFSPFPAHDPAGDAASRCVNLGSGEALQRNDCDSRSNSTPEPGPGLGLGGPGPGLGLGLGLGLGPGFGGGVPVP